MIPFRLYKLVKDIKPDIIQTHLRGIIYSAYSIIKVHSRIPCFHTVHNAAKEETGDFIGSIIRKYLFKKGWCIPVTISTESLKSFISYYGFSAPMIFNGRDVPSNLQVSTSVIDDVNKYKKDEATRIIVQLARFSPVKRQYTMAKIAKRLFDEGYNFSVLMIGREDGVESRKVRDFLPPCVHILGEKSNPIEYLAATDAFALCSSYEGMPISLIEALGVGTVPICTPVGGIRDVIKDKYNGFISEDISEDAYYRALKSFLDTPKEKMEEIRSRALNSYSLYTMEQCARNYENLYNEIYKKYEDSIYCGAEKDYRGRSKSSH